jgi:hypothetical protein
LNEKETLEKCLRKTASDKGKEVKELGHTQWLQRAKKREKARHCVALISLLVNFDFEHYFLCQTVAPLMRNNSQVVLF